MIIIQKLIKCMQLDRSTCILRIWDVCLRVFMFCYAGIVFFIVGVVFWISLFCCVGIVVVFSCGCWRIDWSWSWCCLLELVGGIVGWEIRANFHYVFPPHFPPLANWTDTRWWPVWKTSSHTICFFSSLFSAQPNSRKLLSLLYSLSPLFILCKINVN